MTERSLELVQGTLEFLILKTLSGGTPMHGFDVLHWIAEATDGALLVEEGSLYPALHRMEKREWIESEWGISEKGRRAKFYRLTNAGRKHLIREEKNWNEYVVAVGKIVATADGAP